MRKRVRAACIRHNEEVKKLEKGLYVRKATGLVRQFSTWDMLIFNLFAVSIGLSLMVGPLETASLYPGINFNYILLLGMILCLGNALVWSALMVTMPRSGGIQVVGSYLLHPTLGFMLSWGYMMYYFYASGMYSNWTVRIALPVTLATLGYSSGLPGLVEMSKTVATTTNIIVFGSLVIAFVALISFFPKIQKLVLMSVFAVCMLGSLLTLGVLLTATPESFKAAFDSFLASTAGISNGYEYTLSKAEELGMTIPEFSWSNLFLAIPLGYWMFMGYYASAHISGEIKEPSRGLPISIIGSLLFAWVLYTINIQLFYNVVGWKMTHAIAYLTYIRPEGNPLPYDPYFNLMIGILAGNPVINAIIGISFILWSMFVPVVVFIQATRYAFTWAFYRIAPEKMASVNERYHSPWVAILVTALGTWLFMLIYTLTPFFKVVLKYTLMNSIIFFIIGICAILLPLRKKELFEASPPIVKKKILGIPLIWIGAIVNSILYALVIYSSFSMKLEYWSFVIIVFLPGLIIYYIAKAIRKRQGIDLGLSFREIPPE